LKKKEETLKRFIAGIDWWDVSGCLLVYAIIVSFIFIFIYQNITVTEICLGIMFFCVTILRVGRRRFLAGMQASYLIWYFLLAAFFSPGAMTLKYKWRQLRKETK